MTRGLHSLSRRRNELEAEMGWDLPKLMNADNKPAQVAVGTIWEDNSTDPPVTKRWDGEQWVVVKRVDPAQERVG